MKNFIESVSRTVLWSTMFVICLSAFAYGLAFFVVVAASNAVVGEYEVYVNKETCQQYFVVPFTGVEVTQLECDQRHKANGNL